jgi:adenine-specific DNA-methyltransferase
VFLEALASVGVPRERVTALDLDPRPGKMQRLAELHSGKDFISWSAATALRFDNIVGNPPYITLERVPSRLRTAAYKIEGPGLGRVPRGANYWLAFLYGAVRLLRPGGALGFVLPAAYEYADYAAGWRLWLKKNFRDSLTLRSKERVFAEVQDGSVFLVATGFGESGGVHRVEHCDTASDVPAMLSKARESRISRPPVKIASKYPVVPWSDVFELRLGAVTGDNKCFVFTNARRMELNLPDGACLPMVTRARHIRTAELRQADWEALRCKGEPVWMFRPQASQLRNRAVAQYLDAINTKKKNFRVTARECWHRVDLPQLPQGFISGMTIHGPWICLSRMRGLHATNTLYTVRFKRGVSLDGRARDALALLTSFVRRQIVEIARLYPDGLLKMEPRDLRALVIPLTTRTVGALEVYRRAVRELTAGHESKAMKLADSWFEHTG